MKIKGIPIEERRKASASQGYIAIQKFNNCKGCKHLVEDAYGYPKQRCGIGNFAVGLHGICKLWEARENV